jgi:hypothetical protein
MQKCFYEIPQAAGAEREKLCAVFAVKNVRREIKRTRNSTVSRKGTKTFLICFLCLCRCEDDEKLKFFPFDSKLKL